MGNREGRHGHRMGNRLLKLDPMWGGLLNMLRNRHRRCWGVVRMGRTVGAHSGQLLRVTFTKAARVGAAEVRTSGRQVDMTGFVVIKRSLEGGTGSGSSWCSLVGGVGVGRQDRKGCGNGSRRLRQ